MIIPNLNEEKAIFPVLERVFSAEDVILKNGVTKLEVIVVDDGSTDTSLVKLKEFSKLHPIVILENRKCLGYGAALKKGFSEAQGELIAFMDMDYTYDPFDLPELVARLTSKSGPYPLQMVVGDRLSRIEEMPLTRELGNRLFVAVIRSLFKRRVTDCCSGLRVFRREFVIPFAHLLPNNLNFTLAMTFLFLRFQLPFEEVPIRYHQRIGQSKLSVLIDGPRFLFTIFSFWFKYRFSRIFFLEAKNLMKESGVEIQSF